VLSLGELLAWTTRPAWVPSSSGVYYMKANAALAILALAAAVLLESMPPASWRTPAARALTTLALVVAGITLVEYATGWAPGFDLWLGADRTAAAGRMALQSAVVIALCGVALVTVRSRTGVARWVTDGSLLVSVIALEVMVTGYFNHAVLLYDVTGRSTVAPQSGVAQMLLCAAIILLRVGRGAYALVTAKSAAGMAMRVLVPLVIFLPVVAGRLRLVGERRNWFAGGYGDAISSVVQTAVFGAVVYALARWIDRFEKQYHVERHRRAEYERHVAMCAWTRRMQWEGRWVSVEEFLERRFGLTVSHGISEDALADQLAALEELEQDTERSS
jgi:hypothetical protein